MDGREVSSALNVGGFTDCLPKDLVQETEALEKFPDCSYYCSEIQYRDEGTAKDTSLATVLLAC